ncbi:MAG TPA: FG-GAP-like repeat-containing protein [Candidatus Udaeobacter sp.]|nr:FG-GAP-like repeat-containing protein [Candidatus Udaeobacter sp.]
MKIRISCSTLIMVLWSSGIDPTSGQVSVTQQHNHLSRDGLYVDPAFSPANAANLVRDLNFNGTISGNVYAQPLYVEGGPNGAVVIAVTESNNVYALNAENGSVIWQRSLGPPVVSGLPCGNISPLGITGTPAIDLTSRSLFLDAMIDGNPKRHFVYSLNVDTGATNPGWPVNLDATVSFNGTSFTSTVQNERGGLAIVNGTVYVPFSGHAGDCGTYHGWVIGISIANPASVRAWATAAIGGGIWGHSGVASDGTNMFVITGNTFNTQGNWMGGEAVIRLQAGPVFSGFWAPANWFSLDQTDTDLGGVSATLVDVPGATPSQLVLALGKDGMAYLLDRNNLGGVTAPIASAILPTAVRGQSAATYHTSQGTYFVFHTENNAVAAYKVTATSPPAIIPAWSVNQTGLGSAWVTSTDGVNNAIVWVAGAGGDGRLHAYDGNTGTVIYSGGGANEMMSGTRRWNTGIVARGRIYYPADNKIYAFKVPTTVASAARADAGDVNGDGHPDWVVRNINTRQTGIWYLNNNVFIGSAYGPTLVAGWGLRGLGDFNQDTDPDYALFGLNTRQTAVWYLSGPSYVRGAYGPTLPAGWELVGTADFNGDAKPDYVLYDSSTYQTAIWYMNNNVYIRGDYGPSLPPGWAIVGLADFNRDGHEDYLLFHPSSGYTAIAYLSGPSLIGAAWGPIVPGGWALVATSDFNSDGNPDYILYRADTRQTAIWYLDNNVYISSAFGPTIPPGWSLTGP